MKEGVDDIGFIEKVAQKLGLPMPDKNSSGSLSKQQIEDLESRIDEFVKENPDAQVIGVFKDSIKRIV